MRKKSIISSISFPRDKELVIEEFEKIAERERMSFSELVVSLIEKHVAVHAAGNPSFELDKWVEEPEFKGDPALREDNQKWDKYLEQCDEKDLAQLQGVFQVREKQAKDAWLKKKGFRK